MTSPLFRSAFFTLIVVGIIFQFALYFHLFFTLAWFDMIMHFLGGFFISISVLTIITRTTVRTSPLQDISYGRLLVWGVISALVVGLLWECFELYFGITYLYSPDYVGDNGMDVTMDIAGGLVAVWYGYHLLKRFKKMQA